MILKLGLKFPDFTDVDNGDKSSVVMYIAFYSLSIKAVLNK